MVEKLLGAVNHMPKTDDRNTLNSYVSGHWPGGIFYSGRATYNSFHTVLPPNSPSCMADVSAVLVIAATSYHSGGANVVYMDGSCHFVSDTIHTDNLGEKRTLDGKSLYGVWGAMGTPNGGETASL